MRRLYGEWDMAIYDLDGNRYSTEGYNMSECREMLVDWLKNAKQSYWIW